MSTSKTHNAAICDHCQAKAAWELVDRNWCVIEVRDFNSDKTGSFRTKSTATLHLCDKCKTDFLLWMKDGFN